MAGILACFLLFALYSVPSSNTRAGLGRLAGPPVQASPVTSQQSRSAPEVAFIRIVDENGLAVSGAQVALTNRSGGTAGCTSDYAGICGFSNPGTGPFSLKVEKQGFYVFEASELTERQLENLEVTLNHTQEFSERVDVVSSRRGLNPQRTTATETLDREEIVNLPYPSTRDFRNALPLLPGVLQDATGQLHVDGSETSEVVDQLDGFNITHPGDRTLTLRLSTDALRSMEVLSGRYSAEHGKGSGGVVDLETGMGDDHFRFSATNFFPSLETQGGLSLGSWTPRATFSGPLSKGKAWFFDAADAEYRLRNVTELPSPDNQSRLWRGSNLAKVQFNWSPTRVLTASALVNRQHSDYPELSRFRPLETTTRRRSDASLLTVRQQFFLQNQAVLEGGFGVYTSNSLEDPLGDAPYTILASGYSGNYYRSLDTLARRTQGLLRLTLPPITWHGRHVFRMGTDVDRLTYRFDSSRRSIRILREDGTLSREVRFSATQPQTEHNLETSAFLEDRWSVRDQLYIEAGIRLDRDDVVRRTLLSPRLASSYLWSGGRTKLSAGVGVFYDATPLDLLTAAQTGERTDRFYGPDGQTLEKVAVTSFQVDRGTLQAPRFINWSAEIERQLSPFTFVGVSWMQRRGRHIFVQERLSPDPSQGGPVVLENKRQDRYRALKLTLHRSLPGSSELFAAFTRSSARSNAVVNFDIDNPVFGPQGAGPLAWDSPNRLQCWGWRPLPRFRGFLLAYALEWRTGFPFSYVDEQQDLVGPPNAHRFPAYFSVSVHLEKRVKVFGYQWALRAGVNNLTDRANGTYIDNNIDSPDFLALGGVQGRSFTGRIRFLGHK
ncbi:MAG: TonB-dependent receptor [Acidobacteriota bacterium]